MKKVKLKVRVYDVVAEAVERGCRYGLERINKYVTTIKFSKKANPDQVAADLAGHVMDALCEEVDFND